MLKTLIFQGVVLFSAPIAAILFSLTYPPVHTKLPSMKGYSSSCSDVTLLIPTYPLDLSVSVTS